MCIAKGENIGHYFSVYYVIRQTSKAEINHLLYTRTEKKRLLYR